MIYRHNIFPNPIFRCFLLLALLLGLQAPLRAADAPPTQVQRGGKSQFQATINNRRAPFLEEVINSLNQTGPIGKLITLHVPQEFLPEVGSGKIVIYIEDPTTGAALASPVATGSR